MRKFSHIELADILEKSELFLDGLERTKGVMVTSRPGDVPRKGCLCAISALMVGIGYAEISNEHRQLVPKVKDEERPEVFRGMPFVQVDEAQEVLGLPYRFVQDADHGISKRSIVNRLREGVYKS